MRLSPVRRAGEGCEEELEGEEVGHDVVIALVGRKLVG